MGLLDDAIREHLELKRQHGADPSEVAQKEREAFGAGRPGGATPPAADAADLGVPEADVPTPGPSAPPPEPDAIPEPPVASAPAPPPVAPPPAAAPADRYEPDVEWDEPRRPEPAPAAAEADEDEDVLEETPEFLSETPEHDRLWFEQRPPRDFDF